MKTVILAMLAAVVALTAVPAAAYRHHGWHHGYHRGWHRPYRHYHGWHRHHWHHGYRR